MLCARLLVYEVDGNKKEPVTACAPSRRVDETGPFERQEQVRRLERRRASSMLCSTGWGMAAVLVEEPAGGVEGRQEQTERWKGSLSRSLSPLGSEALLSG